MRCVVCGDLIPEGRQVCWACENGDLFFDDILKANEYGKSRGWASYHINRTEKGYEVKPIEDE